MTTVETADPLAGIADREQVFIGGRWVDSTGDGGSTSSTRGPNAPRRVCGPRRPTMSRGRSRRRGSRSTKGDWVRTPIAERADVIDRHRRRTRSPARRI